MGRHRKQREATGRAVTSGRIAVSVAALGFGALQLGGAAIAAPAAAPAPAPAAKPGVGGTPCTDARIKACVDLSANKTWLLDGKGHVVGAAMGNSHGSKGHETPAGNYIIQRKERYHVSKEYDGASMPYSVFFDNNGRAFHEGKTARQSAGCVRMEQPDAKRTFEHLNPNDRVQIVP